MLKTHLLLLLYAENIFVDILMHFAETYDKWKIQKDSFFTKTELFYNIINIFIYIYIYTVYIYIIYCHFYQFNDLMFPCWVKLLISFFLNK